MTLSKLWGIFYMINKKQLLNIKDYKAYGYTDEYKELNKALNACMTNFIDCDNANAQPIANKTLLEAFLPVAFRCFNDDAYKAFTNMSKTKQKETLSRAIAYSLRKDLQLERASIREAFRVYAVDVTLPLNRLIYQVAIECVTKPIRVENKNFVAKTVNGAK